MIQQGYPTNLASEFYVSSVLCRLGYDASLTLGNKKAIDIVVVRDEGNAITIDVKAVAGRMDWLLGNAMPHEAPTHYVVLLSYEGRFSDVALLPCAWVFPSQQMPPFIKIAGNKTTRYVSRKTIIEQASRFENAWQLLKVQSPP